MKTTNNLTLDLHNNNFVQIKAVQGDAKTRYLSITITEYGAECTIPTTAKATFNARKPDGKCVFNTAEITGNKVVIALTAQTLAAVGTVYCDISLTEKDEILSTLHFDIVVEQSGRDDSAIQSTNEYTELSKSLAKVDDADIKATKALTDSSKALTNSQAAVANSNTANTTANTAKKTAEEATNKLNSASDKIDKLEDIYPKIKDTPVSTLAQNVVDIASTPRNLALCSGNFYEGKNINGISTPTGKAAPTNGEFDVKDGYFSITKTGTGTLENTSLPTTITNAKVGDKYTLFIRAKGKITTYLTACICNNVGVSISSWTAMGTTSTSYATYRVVFTITTAFTGAVVIGIAGNRFTTIGDYVHLEWWGLYAGDVSETVWKDADKDTVKTEIKAEVGAGYVGGIRYIRDWLNGNSINNGNHFVQCQAWVGGSNVALRKTVTANFEPEIHAVSDKSLSRWTDGDIDTGSLIRSNKENAYLQVDLGSVYELDSIKIWHYREPGRKYKTWTEVSADGVNWHRTFDSRVQGEYTETAEGRTHVIKQISTRDIKVGVRNYILNSNLINNGLGYAGRNTNASINRTVKFVDNGFSDGVGYAEVSVQGATENSWVGYSGKLATKTLESNTDYMLTGCYYIDSAVALDGEIRVQVKNHAVNKTVASWQLDDTVTKNKWHQFTIKRTAFDVRDTPHELYPFLSKNGRVRFAKLALTKGNVATDGMPAPEDLKILMLDWIYPVGSIYTSITATNPSNVFGGTWITFGAGRTLVGVDANDVDFNTAKKTGGAKTHTLTTAEMPAHTHPNSKGNPISSGAAAGGYGFHMDGSYAESGSAGGGAAHNNMPPYTTVYFWQRTA